MALLDWVQFNVGSPTVEIANEQSGWFNSSWNFRRTIIIDSASIPTSQVDFPLLVVVDNVLAQASANDVLFTASDGTTQLDHEIESYIQDSFGFGTVVAWVRIPSLSSLSNTVIYIYYNNPLASNQENPTGVWDSNYIGVWHLNQDPSGSAPQIVDSTGNGWGGTSEGSMTSDDLIDGQIDGSLDFDGNDDDIDFGAVTDLPEMALTISVWANPSIITNSRPIVAVDESLTTSESWYMRVDDGDLDFNVEGVSVIGSGAVDADEWQYFVGTFASNTGTIYKNGVFLEDTGIAVGDITYDSKILKIATGGTSGDFFQGGVDEVRISSIVRSEDWIEIEHANQSDPASFLSFGVVEEFEPITPIFGTGSLRQSGVSSLVTMYEDNYPRGLERGRIRELIRIEKWDGPGVYDVGFFFMANVPNLTSSGVCYTYSINSNSDPTDTKVQLQYHALGIQETLSEIIFTGPSFDREDSSGPLIIALELEWVVEQDLLNGILITMREGHSPTLTDFSNLTEVGKVVIFEEELEFLVTSAAEGIYMDSRGSGDLDIIRDRTRITSLVPA